MKKNVFLCLLTAAMVFIFWGCNNEPIDKETDTEINLGIPKNVSISVDGIKMTVTWEAVNKALGYEIITASTDCGSGNRTINTKEKTAVITGSGSSAANVKINEGTSIEITLMASSTSTPDIPMASAVTAKVKSLGGTVSEVVYIDSEYSQTVNKTIDK